ncbi:DNA polymerase-3 subunit alpha [Thermoactinomyces sp. DSM 45891]|uniref:PolC-type DNA polymerase III n=1 Tax=Thermoactinomyces sp. DSM 45891 TaxID=1761907 RepID=UPI00091841C8|nr:PolC-type DNA polymerase III [Thermoactinomyces sp. DSM 45891]SFX31910.1 DNA polymerase-3 subunit alpha [Thermoactinomyces sp. DSM 45891]
MSDPMKNLFEDAKLPWSWYEVYREGRIVKVEVVLDQNSWEIHFEMPTFLPFDRTSEIEKRLQEFYQPICVHTHYTYSHINHSIALTQSKMWIQKQIEENHTRSASSWLAQAEWRFDGKKIDILFPHPTMKQLAERVRVDYLISKYYEQLTRVCLPVILLADMPAEEHKQEFVQKKIETEKAIVEQTLKEQAVLIEQSKASRSTDEGAKVIKIGTSIQDAPLPIREIQEEEKRVTIQGKVFQVESKELRTGKFLFTFFLTDYTDSLTVKYFAEKENMGMVQQVKVGTWLKCRGSVREDTFSRELAMIAHDFVEVQVTTRKDTSGENRVELHAHTSLSAMDGLTSPADLIKTASQWGYKAIAITDHGVVQAFPKAYETAKEKGIKLIYGMEANIVSDGVPVVINPRETELSEETYVVFDVETTGLSVVHDTIIELAAVKIQNGLVVERFSEFANPHRPLTDTIKNLTHITDEMLVDAPEIGDVVQRFVDFIGSSILVAHNARFDMGFLQQAVKRMNQPRIENPVLDTLELARFLYPSMKNHRLNTLSKYLGVTLEQHHRAIYDADTTGTILWKMVQESMKRGLTRLLDLNQNLECFDVKKSRPYHAVLLAKNEIGLYHLYKLVTLSHLEYFYRVPRIPRSKLEEYREGLLIGSGCEQGELYECALNKAPEEVEEVAKFYDYLEVQPIEVNQHLVEKGLVESTERLKEANRLIVRLGEKLNKPVVATSNAHYIQPEEAVHRTILHMSQPGKPVSTSPAYLRTTDEMLQGFSYLGDEKAREIVLTNPQKVAEQVESFQPFPDDLFAPKLEGAEEELRESCYLKAKEWYGDPLPEVVSSRLERELDSIIGNEFAVIYIIARRLVMKSNEDGYLVGSRGSVGSSLVATLSSITEVNPLQPHYRCPSCQYSEFFTDGSYETGYDLPDQRCPKCDALLYKDGQDIPFETFLGFEGDKTPDIDLNFSGEYQHRIHAFTEEWLGKSSVFRAGTIGTVQDKMAYGYARKYAEQKGLTLRNAEIQRLASGCVGVKKTTGQHPGGLMVVPQDSDVLKFTPVQYPADDSEANAPTTHFGYKAIEGRLLKLDLLAHQDPTTLRMLQDTSGIDPVRLPLDNKEVLSIFNRTEALGISPEDIGGLTVGTLGIPEFGTGFVRQMLEDTRPATFSELVRISGLSHGTDVWLGNAHELVKKGHKLSETICTRDEIMSYLMYKGLAPKVAFDIMEKVRKGKGLSPEFEAEMRKNNVPEWYIDSCKKIKYMFPRAHACAYVTMAVRIAWYKVHMPIHYYAAFFYRLLSSFDLENIIKGEGQVRKTTLDIKEKEKNYSASPKERSSITALELAQEFYARGFKFKPIDLYQSHASRFMIDGDFLIPPFATIPGLGANVAQNMAESRKNGEFLSIDDFQKRTKASGTVVDSLKGYGCLIDLPESNQLTLTF